MKTTVKAIIINESPEQKQIIDELMSSFCSAIRFSFKRILEGLKIGDIEKIVSLKYGLNIRQSKDAVENARQTVQSQKELLKLNYSNYFKKVETIENKLKRPQTNNKSRNLLSKLEKRQRKLAFYKKHIDNNTIPPLIFGTKELFLRRCKGLISHEEWQDARSNRIYSRGDKAKKGNPNLRLILVSNKTYLEISTLEKSNTGRYKKILVEVYLPQKVSKKTGEINGRNYKRMLLDYIQTGEAYQVELIRKNGCYYCHITFNEEMVSDFKVQHTGHLGIIGIDTNPDGFALTKIKKDGNYQWHKYVSNHELLYSRSNRRENLCGELVSKVIRIAKEDCSAIAIEDLNFADDIEVSRKFARIKNQFVYSKLLKMLETSCKRNGIELIKVKPQFTSKIGLYKYCHQYGMVIHNGAAMVIARRSYGFKEKIPKELKDKLVYSLNDFFLMNEWQRWAFINRIIKRKVGENPDSWIVNRKSILELTNS